MGFLQRLLKKEESKKLVCAAVVPAAGSSQRMGGENKLLLPLDGVPVIVRTVQALEAAQSISEIVIATRECDMLAIADVLKAFGIRKPLRIVVGGESRLHSVYNACLQIDAAVPLIAVHDGGRPLVTPALIDRTVEQAAKCFAAAPAIPVKDTIKQAKEGIVTETPRRSELFAVQTPQVFDGALLKAALQSAIEENAEVTDDCSCVERLGKQIYLTEGDEENIKITTPLDVKIAQAILERRMENGL